MKLSLALMGHPRRQHFIEQLLEVLPGTEVVLDRCNDRWDTGRRSMLAFDRSADYHLVVQDDAILCRDFRAGVEAALSCVPSSPVSFYTGKVRPFAVSVTQAVQRARSAGKPWLAMRGPHWGVAVAIPTPLIEEMIEWCDRQVGVPNYDRRMEKYFTGRGILCWHSIPSLVNHRVGEENPSLVPGRGAAPSRTAHEWIGERSPLNIDWSKGALSAPDTPSAAESRASGPLPQKGPRMLRYAMRDIYTGSGAYRSLLVRAGQLIPRRLAHLVDEADTSPQPVAPGPVASAAAEVQPAPEPAAATVPSIRPEVEPSAEQGEGMTACATATAPPVDYSSLTRAQLMELLVGRDIKYSPRAKKGELIELLEH